MEKKQDNPVETSLVVCLEDSEGDSYTSDENDTMEARRATSRQEASSYTEKLRLIVCTEEQGAILSQLEVLTMVVKVVEFLRNCDRNGLSFCEQEIPDFSKTSPRTRKWLGTASADVKAEIAREKAKEWRSKRSALLKELQDFLADAIEGSDFVRKCRAARWSANEVLYRTHAYLENKMWQGAILTQERESPSWMTQIKLPQEKLPQQETMKDENLYADESHDFSPIQFVEEPVKRRTPSPHIISAIDMEKPYLSWNNNNGGFPAPIPVLNENYAALSSNSTESKIYTELTPVAFSSTSANNTYTVLKSASESLARAQFASLVSNFPIL